MSEMSEEYSYQENRFNTMAAIMQNRTARWFRLREDEERLMLNGRVWAESDDQMSREIGTGHQIVTVIDVKGNDVKFSIIKYNSYSKITSNLNKLMY